MRFLFLIFCFHGNDGLELPETSKKNLNRTVWIPACSGMTSFEITVYREGWETVGIM
ncbi:hypothetical protein HMPREF0602_0249 [Neisseria meningitidis ATCC 13091]|uniref:Uncharacterized protein n=1 Tax=Neisseria meningitidis serogroup B (strain ATCC 13091 / M2091) TaxID=862513 RepID=E0N6W9_NEIM3|nr:hypothetical protein HMPREF0602_0249 [Neisseria meningitidis ATCC 13091]